MNKEIDGLNILFKMTATYSNYETQGLEYTPCNHDTPLIQMMNQKLTKESMFFSYFGNIKIGTHLQKVPNPIQLVYPLYPGEVV